MGRRTRRSRDRGVEVEIGGSDGFFGVVVFNVWFIVRLWSSWCRW